MVSEVRRLVFSREEIIQAVEQFAAAAKIELPPGHITDATVSATHVALTIERLGAQSVARRDLGMAELASLLMRYCRHLKIPIPRHSSKSLIGLGGGAVFEITLHTVGAAVRPG